MNRIETDQEKNDFRLQVRDIFRKESLYCRRVRVAKDDRIYASGDRDGMVYLVEDGQVNEILFSPEGKECLMAIHLAGDVFGEMASCGQHHRMDTTVARHETTIRRMPGTCFFNALKKEGLLEGFMQYLIMRIVDQNQVIGTMATLNSEQRLAFTLLRLAKKIGTEEADGIRLRPFLSHWELSRMVGTTRPRVCTFLRKFRRLGLIELNQQRLLIRRQQVLKYYPKACAFMDAQSIA
jgi:CRP/FNR family transcriptional regulator, cyclic AMP receptor protein